VAVVEGVNAKEDEMSGSGSLLVAEKKERVATQLEVLRGVLLKAAEREEWMTLGELAKNTDFPEASISAQLRHLRKKEHGGYRVEKRVREADEAPRTGVKEMVWEYRVRTEIKEANEIKDVEEVKENHAANLG
jgi:hypothetical protein